MAFRTGKGMHRPIPRLQNHLQSHQISLQKFSITLCLPDGSTPLLALPFPSPRERVPCHGSLLHFTLPSTELGAGFGHKISANRHTDGLCLWQIPGCEGDVSRAWSVSSPLSPSFPTSNPCDALSPQPSKQFLLSPAHPIVPLHRESIKVIKKACSSSGFVFSRWLQLFSSKLAAGY